MQPYSESLCRYPPATAFGRGLGVSDSKAVLWKSVSALMLKHYGGENLSRLSRECKIALASSARIKEQKTSVGLDIVDKIARHFHVEPWELLVPTFDPANRPTLQPLSEMERKLYARLAEVAKEIKEGGR